jgi:hypothetical protein
VSFPPRQACLERQFRGPGGSGQPRYKIKKRAPMGLRNPSVLALGSRSGNITKAGCGSLVVPAGRARAERAMGLNGWVGARAAALAKTSSSRNQPPSPTQPPIVYFLSPALLPSNLFMSAQCARSARPPAIPEHRCAETQPRDPAVRDFRVLRGCPAAKVVESGVEPSKFRESGGFAGLREDHASPPAPLPSRSGKSGVRCLSAANQAAYLFS